MPPLLTHGIHGHHCRLFLSIPPDRYAVGISSMLVNANPRTEEMHHHSHLSVPCTHRHRLVFYSWGWPLPSGLAITLGAGLYPWSGPQPARRPHRQGTPITCMVFPQTSCVARMHEDPHCHLTHCKYKSHCGIISNNHVQGHGMGLVWDP
jgi:hypothetical protein